MDASTVSHLVELVTKSPNLTSLTLIGFQLTNEMARNLVEVEMASIRFSSLFNWIPSILLQKTINIWRLFAEFSKTEVPEFVQIA